MEKVVTGYKGNLYGVDLGYYVADCNGRGGKVVEITENPDSGDVTIRAASKEGIILELQGCELSFATTPDPEVM